MAYRITGEDISCKDEKMTHRELFKIRWRGLLDQYLRRDVSPHTVIGDSFLGCRVGMLGHVEGSDEMHCQLTSIRCE